jgi:hypothetical protein
MPEVWTLPPAKQPRAFNLNDELRMQAEEFAGTLVAGPILSPSAEPALNALRETGHELVLSYEGVSHREISAVRWGQASFALIVEPPLIVLSYRFGEAIPWALAPFRWNEFSTRDRMTAQWDEQEFLAQPNLRVSLVESSDGRVLANRVAPLSRSLSRAWVAAIRRQGIQRCSNARYSAALSQFTRRFPRPDALLGMAIATSIDGE